MAIEYRLMNGDEMEQVFDLWAAVYPGTERESWKREFLSVPGSLEHTYVALEGGRVVSTALLWVREMNDAAGILQRVGNLSHVATHPEARRRGHAQRLLELAIEQMEQENCGFATLFTSDEGRPLYERLSWRTCPLYFWQGGLARVDLPIDTGYTTRPADWTKEPDLWKVLADIYTDYNQARPFAIQRDEPTWRSFTAYKITDWVQAGAAVWLAAPARARETVCGYLIAHCSEQGFLIAEMGVKEEHRAAIANLLSNVISSYEPGQPVGGRLYLPNEPDILPLLHACFHPLMQIESTELMVRPVNPEKDRGGFIPRRSGEAGMVWILDQL